MNETSAIDPEALRRLEEWGGPKLVRQMIDIFLKAAPERLEQIRAGLADEVLEPVERAAHSLKSSAGNLGAVRVQAVAQRIEDAAEEGRTEEARVLLPDLETYCQAATAELADLLDR